MRKHPFIAAAFAALVCACAPAVGTLEQSVSDGIRVSKRISREGKNVWKVEWTFTAREDVDSARICVGYNSGASPRWWMLPAISYNGNDWGKGHEPKGATEGGQMRTYSYRRSPIPGAIYSENSFCAAGTWCDIPPEGFSFGILPASDGCHHSYILPQEEMPVTYFDRDRFAPGWSNSLNMKKGEKRSLTMHLFVTRSRDSFGAAGDFMDECWRRHPEVDFGSPSVDDVWNLKIRFVKESLWAEEGPYRGFSIGLLPFGNDGWQQRRVWKYESGWCGQNISLGCSLLTDYLRTGSESSREKGFATLDCWAENCPLENGLFITHFDHILYGTDGVMDACNLGVTAMNYIEAARLAELCGAERPNYLQIALGICDFALSEQTPDGCYGRGWTRDGVCVERDGTVGAFLIPAVIDAYSATSKEEYLASARRAYDHYFGQLRQCGYTTAGALDTWCIDKESAISLLRSALRLYRIEGGQSYLDDALMVSRYLSTWMWHYDAEYAEDDAFSIYGYHTFGATSVSVQHHHLDPYASLWIPEWVELSSLTGDEQWREKAFAVWRNCTQLISDGTLVVNGRIRPAGSQNEAYFESSWGFGSGGASADSRPDRVNDWLVCWPGAFLLETLRHLK